MLIDFMFIAKHKPTEIKTTTGSPVSVTILQHKS